MPKLVLGLGYTTDPAHETETLRLFLEKKLDSCRGWRSQIIFLTEDYDQSNTMQTRVQTAYRHALQIRESHPHVRLCAYQSHCTLSWDAPEGPIPAGGFITIFLAKSGVVKQVFTPMIDPAHERYLPAIRMQLTKDFEKASEQLQWGKKTTDDERFIQEIVNRTNAGMIEFMHQRPSLKVLN